MLDNVTGTVVCLKPSESVWISVHDCLTELRNQMTIVSAWHALVHIQGVSTVTELTLCHCVCAQIVYTT